MAKLSKFIDTSVCTACRGCQTACKNWNELPATDTTFTGSYQTMADTDHQTYTIVTMKERYHGDFKYDWFFRKHGCMHCRDASCILACPEEAVYRTESGAVVKDPEKCIGCGYCSNYCPFGVPKIDEEKNQMMKCTMCFDRVANDLTPACAKTCPPQAVKFGPREDMIKEAQARLEEVKDKYPKANIYGLDDQFLGGTNVIYLLLEEPGFYDLPANPKVPATLGLWKDVVQPVGKILPLGALGAVLAATFVTRVKGNSQDDKGGDKHGK